VSARKGFTAAEWATSKPLIVKAALACLRYEAACLALDDDDDSAVVRAWREHAAAEDNLDRVGKRLRVALEELHAEPTAKRRGSK